MRRLAIGLSIFAFGALGLAQAEAAKPAKVSICHKTSSATSPYVLVKVRGAVAARHVMHHQDVMPVPAGGCRSLRALTPARGGVRLGNVNCHDLQAGRAVVGLEIEGRAPVAEIAVIVGEALDQSARLRGWPGEIDQRHFIAIVGPDRAGDDQPLAVLADRRAMTVIGVAGSVKGRLYNSGTTRWVTKLAEDTRSARNRGWRVAGRSEGTAGRGLGPDSGTRGEERRALSGPEQLVTAGWPRQSESASVPRNEGPWATGARSPGATGSASNPCRPDGWSRPSGAQ